MAIILDEPDDDEIDVFVSIDVEQVTHVHVEFHDTNLFQDRDEWKIYLNGQLNKTVPAPQGSYSGSVDNVSFGTEYDWYVELWEGGGLVETSATFTFTTIAGGASKPVNPSPGNGVTDVKLSPNLTWEAG